MRPRAETPIFKAIRKNNLKKVIQFLNAGATFNGTNAEGLNTIGYAAKLHAWDIVHAISDLCSGHVYCGQALIYAVKADRVETAATLMRRPDNASNVYDSHGKRLLYYAVINKNPRMIKLLMQWDADILLASNLRDNDKKKPLEHAVDLEAWDCVIQIAHSLNMETIEKIKSSKELTAWYFGIVAKLAEKNQWEAVKALTTYFDFISIQQNGNYPAHWAVIHHNIDAINHLRSRRCNFEVRNKDLKTSYQLACELGDLDCASALKPDVADCVDSHGNKYGALFIDAVSRGDLPSAKALHAAGASTTAKLLKTGDTALHIICGKGYYPNDWLEFLLSINADQTSVNNANQTPIVLACAKEDWNTARILLEQNASKKLSANELMDLHYEDALFIAVYKGHIQTVKMLLEQGAPCDSWDYGRGNLAIHCAINSHHNNAADIVSLLLLHGANPNHQTTNGDTSHNLAERENMSAIVDRLSVMDTGVTPERIKDKMRNIRKNVEELAEKRVQRPDDLFETIYKIHTVYSSVFRNDLLRLKSDRYVLQNRENNPQKLALVERQILVLQQVLASHEHHHNQDLPLDDELLATETGKHLLSYARDVETLNNAVAQVKEYLLGLKHRIESHRVDNHHWHVKTFWTALFFGWSDGVPKSIAAIEQALTVLDKPHDDIAILNAYTSVSHQLARISADRWRHKDTQTFYNNEKSAIKAHRFFAPLKPMVERAASLPIITHKF